jgi:hypothetical protein
MKIRKNGTWVLWYECVGFGLIILLSWMDELQGLPAYLFGGRPHAGDWRDSGMETMIILFVWAIVFGVSKRLVDHLHYLEGCLRICAWCRKVGHDGQWMKMEKYFSEGFQIATSHSVCPDCKKKLEEDTAEFHRKRRESVGTVGA